MLSVRHSHNVSVSDRGCGERCCICLIMFLFLTGVVERGVAYVSSCFCFGQGLWREALHMSHNVSVSDRGCGERCCICL